MIPGFHPLSGLVVCFDFVDFVDFADFLHTPLTPRYDFLHTPLTPRYMLIRCHPICYFLALLMTLLMRLFGVFLLLSLIVLQ